LAASVFEDTDNSGTLKIHVGSGNVGGYESAWSVAAETAADGNTTAYGNGHKAINIVGD
jgi:hypothetical protein